FAWGWRQSRRGFHRTGWRCAGDGRGNAPWRLLSCGFVPGQAQAAEGPAHVWIEEVAVAGAQVIRRGDATAAAQHLLAAHELAVVFAEAAAQGLEAGVG